MQFTCFYQWVTHLEMELLRLNSFLSWVWTRLWSWCFFLHLCRIACHQHWTGMSAVSRLYESSRSQTGIGKMFCLSCPSSIPRDLSELWLPRLPLLAFVLAHSCPSTETCRGHQLPKPPVVNRILAFILNRPSIWICLGSPGKFAAHCFYELLELLLKTQPSFSCLQGTSCL